MDKFTRISSIAAPLAEADIDTDIIFPARFLLLLDKQGLGKHLFHERRYDRNGQVSDFILNKEPFNAAKILVADSNFGSGSSREQAVWALKDFGFRCLIAPSFGEIFYSNCFKNGLLPLVVDADQHTGIMAAARTGQPFTVDLETQTITLPNGLVIAFDVEPYRKRALLLGLDDIGAILSDDASDISTFEAAHRRLQPWMFLTKDRLSQIPQAKGGSGEPE